LAHARRVSTLISFLKDFVLIVQANKFTEAPPPYFLRGRKNPGPAERQED
jgi:hypothetical protein